MRHVTCAALLLLLAVTPALPQRVPPELPSHLEAIAPHLNLASGKTVTIAVTSRRPQDPDTPQDLERLRRRVLEALPKIPFTPVPNNTTADLSLELIVENNVRYGMFHDQNAPYLYLTLRQTSGKLVYCAYQRAGHFHSATETLLHNLESTVQHTRTTPTGSIEACAEQAMRPL